MNAQAEYHAMKLIDVLHESTNQNDVAFAGLVVVAMKRWKANRAAAFLRKVREMPTNWQQADLTQLGPSVN